VPQLQHAGPRFLAFGGLRLVDSAGAPLADILKQTKPLALLAYLAVATPRGHHRRDRLVGLFWPDLDDLHARGALRKAIHLLRRGLGEGVVDAIGDEAVGLTPGTLWSDVEAFDQSIEAGHTARALELYRGDILPSFFVRDAGEFDQWLEETRASYRKQAASAAWVLAELAERSENTTNATNWARRAVALAPEDERVIRKAIALLARVGDRAGAIVLYESFRARIARDFDVSPAPETMALVRQIREG
jgi:DNA-binding SARP family transcriptional activator